MVKISKGLFRYAVGQEIILHILAGGMGVISDVVEKLRVRAIKNVRRTRGKVSLKAIADFQNGDAVDDSQEDDHPIEERLEELLQLYLEGKEAENSDG